MRSNIETDPVLSAGPASIARLGSIDVWDQLDPGGQPVIARPFLNSSVNQTQLPYYLQRWSTEQKTHLLSSPPLPKRMLAIAPHPRRMLSRPILPGQHRPQANLLAHAPRPLLVRLRSQALNSAAKPFLPVTCSHKLHRGVSQIRLIRHLLILQSFS